MEFSRNKIARQTRYLRYASYPLFTPVSLFQSCSAAQGTSSRRHLRFDRAYAYAMAPTLPDSFRTSLRSNIEPFYLLSGDRGAGNLIRNAREASSSTCMFHRTRDFLQLLFPSVYILYVKTKSVSNIYRDEGQSIFALTTFFNLSAN